MQTGRVIKGYSSFYYVESSAGIIECRLRGKLKLSYNSVLVGDMVVFQQNGDKGVIQDILPRDTQLVRPPIANVELGIIIFSLTNPDPVLELLDRIIIAFEFAGIKPLLVFTKTDLVEDFSDSPVGIYQNLGYEVIFTSAKTNYGIEEVREKLTGKISVVAGPSGAGKSTLLNAIQPNLKLSTGEVSDKIGRGKHTTRHVELLPLSGGGYVADTPGFSVLYLPEIKPQELSDLYIEFLPLKNQCKFTGCLHKAEPQCAVKAALEQGKIDKGRYERYLVFLEQLTEKERRQYD